MDVIVELREQMRAYTHENRDQLFLHVIKLQILAIF